MKLSGGMCAIATPFQASGAIDSDALGRLVDYQLEGGCTAFIVAGSTGEAHFLTATEYDQLVGFVVARVAGRVPVVAGAGAAGTQQAIAAVRHAAQLGADAALVVAPYYVRPTQHGMLSHYRAVADQGGLPILLYNVPSRTACDLLPETTAQLVGHPNIIGIKEAIGTPERIAALAKLVTPSFELLSGDDYTAADAMLAGAAGTISVVANLVPRQFAALCAAATGGDAAATQAGLQQLEPLLAALKCAPNPIPVKAGLALLGFGDGSLRLPLEKLSDQAALEHLRGALQELVPERVVAA